MDSHPQAPAADPSTTTRPSEPGPDTPRRIFNARSILFIVFCGLLAYLAVSFLTPVTGRATAPETHIVQPTPTALSVPSPAQVHVPTAAPSVPPAPVPAG